MQRFVGSSSRGSFIGRGEERRQLEAFLRGGERLISIVGPSGMGKTSLAREVARGSTGTLAFEGGTWFCDLSTTGSRVDLVAHVAHVLGLSEGGRASNEAQLFRALQARGGGDLLLVLDNCQHLDRGARLLVGAWVDAVPGLRVLATSLAPLRLEGELLFELGPLDLDSAVRLYMERAREVRSERRFNEAETRLVTGLVEHLDRYPLAIELAAARVQTLAPKLMLERIDERFSLLDSEGLGHHRSLEWALRSSWELLDAQERSALARASIFEGGFTLEAAEAVMRPPRGGGRPVVDLLESLREKALIQLRDESEPRFTLYESVQAFAARQLEESGDREEAASLHTAYFLRYAETWILEVDGAQGHLAIARFAADRANLLAASARLVKSAPREAAAASLAVCYVAARGGIPIAEMELLERTIATARRADAPLLLAHALRCRISLNRRAEDSLQLRGDIDEAIALAEAAGDLNLAGQMWNNRSMGHLAEGRVAAAKAALGKAKEFEDRLAEPMLVGTNRMSEGTLAIHRGDLQEALEQFHASLIAFRRCGNLHFQARALLRVGGALVALGTPREAREHLLEALRIFRLLLDPGSEADIRLALGCIEREEGQLGDAEEHLAAALPVHHQLGNHRFEGQTLWNLGLIAMEKGELSLAENRLREARALFEGTGDELNLARLLPNLAVIEAFLGRVDEATSKLLAARGHLQAAGSPSDLEILELLEGFVDLARARKAAQGSRFAEAAAFQERATRRLRRSVDMENGSLQAGSQKRILTKTIERYAGLEAQPQGDGSAAGRPSEEEDARLLIGPEAAWFERAGGPRVHLRARSVRRRLLQALVDSRLFTPGLGMSVEAMFQIGWPGSETHPYAAAKRVYDSVEQMRRLGLGEALLRNADGYLLSPEVEIQRVAD